MAKEKEASIYKRRILDFKEFAKGKDSVQEPKKHIIKEGAENTPTSRDEMLKLLHQKFPNVIARSEPFQKDDTRGIWSGAEDSSFIDAAKKISAFNPTGAYSYNPRLNKDYEDEVHKTLAKFLKDHRWYTEFYDDATPIFYPVWGANESLILEKELTQDAKDFIAKKIKTLIGEGRPQKQAVAMAYSYAKKEGYDIPNESATTDDFAKKEGYRHVGIDIKWFVNFWKTKGYKQKDAEDLAHEDYKESIFHTLSKNTFEQIKRDSPGIIRKTIWELTKDGLVAKEIWERSSVKDGSKVGDKYLGHGKWIKVEESHTFESDATSDELVKGKVYKIYDRDDNGKLYKAAARFDGLDGAKGNKFALVNMPVESFIWIKADKMESFLFTETRAWAQNKRKK